MDLDAIYNLLKLWFCTWLIFEFLRFISLDIRKLASLLRGQKGA